MWVCVGGGGDTPPGPCTEKFLNSIQLEVASAGPCIYLGSQSSCDTHPGSPLALGIKNLTKLNI